MYPEAILNVVRSAAGFCGPVESVEIVVRACDFGFCRAVPAQEAKHLICHNGWGSFGVAATERGMEALKNFK